MTDEKALSTLGSNLKRIRTERHWTLEALARESGLSTGMLSQMERGTGNPSFKTLYRLAKALRMPLGSFLVEVDRPDRIGQATRTHDPRPLSGFRDEQEERRTCLPTLDP